MVDLLHRDYLVTKTADGLTNHCGWTYYQTKYLRSQNADDVLSYYLVDKGSNTIQSQIHFSIKEGSAFSFRFSPFGSFFSKGLEDSVATKFLKFIEEDLQSTGIKEIVLRHPAPIYKTDQMWPDLLQNQGYLRHDQINHHIPITKEPFNLFIHHMERRKLLKSDSFVWALESVDKFSVVYDFIAACRSRQGRSLSMSKRDLGRVVEALPDRFLFPVVHSKRQMAAASIIIKASAEVWYNFYPAHDADFDSLSPLVYLTDQLYGYAQESGIEAIDLGTSDVDGEVNAGLVQFKSRIGGLVTTKPTFSKVLS